MDFDAFIAATWEDHAGQPEAVAARLALAASIERIIAPAEVGRYVALVTHVYGEHLGRWDDGRALLARIGALPVAQDDAGAAGALRRGTALLRYAGDGADLPDDLGRDDRIAVLANAAAALAGRKDFARAIAAYRDALTLAADGAVPGAPAPRALAAGGNQLAYALESRAARDAAETAAMIAAAEGALRYWKIAGTWIEEERAQYRLARSQIAAGHGSAALASADACLRICFENQAPAFELFFAHAALALARRTAGDAHGFAQSRRAALEAHAALAPDDAQWCADDLAALDAAAAVPA